jgi:hypothetical protein
MQETQILDRQDNFKTGPSSLSPSSARRTLKIENLGDPWRGKVFAGIRLRGRWLVRAGFQPGQRVSVTVSSPGSMQLRVMPESTTTASRVSGPEQSPLALELADGAEQSIQPKE